MKTRCWMVFLLALVIGLSFSIHGMTEERSYVYKEYDNGIKFILVVGDDGAYMCTELKKFIELNSSRAAAKAAARASLQAAVLSLGKEPDSVVKTADGTVRIRHSGMVQAAPFEKDGWMIIELKNAKVDGKPIDK